MYGEDGTIFIQIIYIYIYTRNRVLPKSCPRSETPLHFYVQYCVKNVFLLYINIPCVIKYILICTLDSVTETVSEMDRFWTKCTNWRVKRSGIKFNLYKKTCICTNMLTIVLYKCPIYIWNIVDICNTCLICYSRNLSWGGRGQWTLQIWFATKFAQSLSPGQL